ncbi:cobalamin-binding protein [Parahalioglobus pacificus]|uniref:Vitamin B12-binding protein n=1 Tax=Parahalioglobus pacificus TaxID=930806 RepID=A0A919CJ96_9GAMM|nr:cobalamin-binding protein [Halioglobus pacificus]GHD30000.1 vitamin B12-binding protein [Halioglobus pacificus]
MSMTRQNALVRVLCLWLLIVGSAQAAINVVDFHDREVTLERPAQRIVALAPHIVENTFTAGAGDKVVGTVEYADHPEDAKNIPRLGRTYSWSLEAVLAAEPDLVLLWGTGKGTEQLPALERLGIPVYVSEPQTIRDISKSIRDIGTLAGTETVATAAAQSLEMAFEKLQAAHSNQQRLSVLYQVWNEPLQTVNNQSMISAVIEICGGQNAFGDLPMIAPKISIESVLQRNPDVIVASGMSSARPEWLDEWRAFPALRAVQTDALLFVEPDHIQRATARLILGAKSLCTQLDEVRHRQFAE